jgi:hypothetical protein
MAFHNIGKKQLMNNEISKFSNGADFMLRPHSFHIPVMGTGFTVDTPLKVARYGISSVVSLDDHLIEQIRKYHCDRLGEPYQEIAREENDSRARRITAYLDFLDRQVSRQVKTLQTSPFEQNSEIDKYYRMLPESPLKQLYQDMLVTSDPAQKNQMQDYLRHRAIPGSIDANIMAKADRELYRGNQKLPPEYSLAMSGLRGYANSTLRSSIIFSAGMNQRLYNYIASFSDFLPDACGKLKKKIILKVSDFRSAFIQGKYLALRGLWVSEYRVESGLNCGGHAFPAKGQLIGTILKEFKDKRAELTEQLHGIYRKALTKLGDYSVETSYPVRVTVQGGIGSVDEDQLMYELFAVDGTGWGTPFLLVPEVTNVDDEHLRKLLAATSDDVYLSESSPLGAPFWNLRNSSSEQARRQRINDGHPGCACPQGFLVSDIEFSEKPICTASRTYQKAKLAQLAHNDSIPSQNKINEESIIAKSCICRDLAGGAKVKYGIDSGAKAAICPGPNIVNFRKIATLEEMVDHIYGRLTPLANPNRPHIFVTELMLNLEYLRKEFENYSQGLINRNQEYFREFRQNLLNGIDYYQQLAEKNLFGKLRERYQKDILTMQNLREVIENIQLNLVPEACIAT